VTQRIRLVGCFSSVPTSSSACFPAVPCPLLKCHCSVHKWDSLSRIGRLRVLLQPSGCWMRRLRPESIQVSTAHFSNCECEQQDGVTCTCPSSSSVVIFFVFQGFDRSSVPKSRAVRPHRLWTTAQCWRTHAALPDDVRPFRSVGFNRPRLGCVIISLPRFGMSSDARGTFMPFTKANARAVCRCAIERVALALRFRGRQVRRSTPFHHTRCSTSTSTSSSSTRHLRHGTSRLC
jgi:hypothetical protein